MRTEFRSERALLLKKRRELYEAGDDDQAYQDVVREIYLKQETLFNQMCEEVLDEFSIAKDIFLESQSAYTRDPSTKEELIRAIQTGQLSRETLTENPDLAKSMQATIGAVHPKASLLREVTKNALRESTAGYVR